ncbi:hypothetical protein [Gloeobacter kilaueensis]|uniref:Uncharacterized protein n=1 Tax=Gloeobacter kilaueensis (strain ATCC BAA-2537 / CCAP 1431/1 / ULC 316 / JS1) TaxID=1183438 RepID=U5QFI7_GLOK1|nr:hypothetical protein [Gloeobacter kilaueensis]AGY57648.1 hypothetical protein GKIL_1402 [Gloeobacter kilaueensis JS1]
MSEQTSNPQPWMPDEATRQQLAEQLRAARMDLRQDSEAIQQLIDELEQRQAQSLVGRFDARRQQEAQVKRAETA